MPIVAVHIRRCDGRHADNAAFNADKDLGSVFQDGNYGRGWYGSSNGNDPVLFPPIDHIAITIELDFRAELSNRRAGFVIHRVKTGHAPNGGSRTGISATTTGSIRCLGC